MRAAVFLSLLATKWNVFWVLAGGHEDEGDPRFLAEPSEGTGDMSRRGCIGAARAEPALCWVEGTEGAFGEAVAGGESRSATMSAVDTEGAVLLGVVPYVKGGGAPAAAIVFDGVTCVHFCNTASARSKMSLGIV